MLVFLLVSFISVFAIPSYTTLMPVIADQVLHVGVSGLGTLIYAIAGPAERPAMTNYPPTSYPPAGYPPGYQPGSYDPGGYPPTYQPGGYPPPTYPPSGGPPLYPQT